MPSDKHNLRMARDRDLISSLINVTSSQDVPFHQPQLLQCLHHGVTFVPLWSLILRSASAIFMSRIEAITCLLQIVTLHSCEEKYMPSLLCYQTSSTLLKLWHYGFHVSRYGHVFHKYILRIFRNGWMDCRDAFHAVLCLYCCVTDKI